MVPRTRQARPALAQRSLSREFENYRWRWPGRFRRRLLDRKKPRRGRSRIHAEVELVLGTRLCFTVVAQMHYSENYLRPRAWLASGKLRARASERGARRHFCFMNLTPTPSGNRRLSMHDRLAEAARGADTVDDGEA